MTAVVVTVALLGLCASAATAPLDAPTRLNELDETPAAISSDLDFPSLLIGQEVVFDPYSDTPDDPAALAILSLNTTLEVLKPPAVLLLPLGLACVALLVTVRRLASLVQSLKKPSRPGRRKVRREFRMMA